MTDKLTSRKFIVWITATVFLAGALVLAFVTRDSALVLSFTPWWGGISMAYIGANVAQKFTPTLEKTEEEK